MPAGPPFGELSGEWSSPCMPRSNSLRNPPRGRAASYGDNGRGKQSVSGMLADVGSKKLTGDYPFPGWEPFLPHLVHPLKVAIVEALLWIREPLSAVQLGK